MRYRVIDATGNNVSEAAIRDFNLAPWQQKDIQSELKLAGAHRWSLDTPYLYTLVTEIRNGENNKGPDPDSVYPFASV